MSSNNTTNEIEFLRNELERVKRIAMHRLEVHKQRMIIVAEHDANLARKLADLAPLSSERVTDPNWVGSMLDRLSEEPPMDHEMDHGYRGAIPR